MTATTRALAGEESLKGLLEQARDGSIQVPEFQRELHLEDEWIKSLLASVSLNYPIGAVTFLQSGYADLRFRTDPVAGAPAFSIEPERVLLDGQHRIAALYQALASDHAVQVQAEHQGFAPRWYYVDIDAALDSNADRDDTIISVPEDRRVRTRGEIELDLSGTELEWGRHLFPLRLVFGADGERRQWLHGFAEHGSGESVGAREQLTSRFETEVLQAFEGYLLSTIIVGKERARWAVRVHGGRDGRGLSDRFRIAGGE